MIPGESRASTVLRKLGISVYEVSTHPRYTDEETGSHSKAKPPNPHGYTAEKWQNQSSSKALAIVPGTDLSRSGAETQDIPQPEQLVWTQANKRCL